MGDEEDVKKLINFLKTCRTKEELQIDFVESDITDDEEEYSEVQLDETEYSNLETNNLRDHTVIACLNQEERQVIDSCPDPQLKKLLSLNRQKYIQLSQLYKYLKDTLTECQGNMVVAKELHSQNIKYLKNQSKSLVRKIGAPYFKDKSMYPCPPNEDTLEKQRKTEISPYDIYNFNSKWKYSECQKLIGAVKINYNYNKKAFIKKEIALREKKLIIESLDNAQLQEINDEINDLKNNLKYYEDNVEIVPPINTTEFLDWIRISTVFFQDKRSEDDCRLFWNNYLHPDINKSTWTANEKERLSALAKTYNYQNWDKIAEELKTNRKAFLVFHYFINNLVERFKRSDFTKEEDEKILKIASLYKIGNYIPWSKVATQFKDRSRIQLRSRYKHLQESSKQLGKFSNAEDVLLMILIDRYGQDYTKCSEYFPNRTPSQLSSRFSCNLNNSLKKGQFSVEEDKEIIEFVEKNGQSWAVLAKKLNRSRILVRQRYFTILKYLQSNPEIKIDNVPRRSLVRSNSSEDFLRIVADEFRDSKEVPSLADIRQLLRKYCVIENDSNDTSELSIVPQTSHSSNHNLEDIDLLLTDFFCNSIKTKAPNKSVSVQNIKIAVDNVQVILKMFKATLKIPENFRENTNLDATDIAILNSLIESTELNTKTNLYCLPFNSSSSKIESVIPPNIFTCACLRSLIIKYQQLKKFNEKLIKSDKSKVALQKRQLFYERFHLMLKWPSILSLLEPPRACIESATQAKQTVAKKSYNRKNAKRIKLN